jgi:hypothetical protein
MRDEQITDAVLTAVLDSLARYGHELEVFARGINAMLQRMTELEQGLRRIEAGLRNRGSL